MKKLFNWTYLSSTVLVFAFIGLLGVIGVQFDFLNVFEEVIEDYDITDVYFNKIRDQQTVPYEDRIVLVNIGEASLGRRSIAQQISILNQYHPKVIGVDAKFFSLKEEDPIGDFMLEGAFAEAQQLVLAAEFAVLTDTSKGWDTLYLPPANFAQHATIAYVNVGNQEVSDFTTWRSIPVREKTMQGLSAPCFAVQVAALYDSAAAARFMARNNEIEHIYFKGNLDKYTKLDVEDVLEERFDPSLIEGKIVLIGYLGSEYTNYHFDEDKFYTPLNEKQVGRGTPDMYGVVVHANIVSMILDQNYINETPQWLSILIALMVCYFNVALFVNILLNKRLAPYYGLTKLIQLVEIILIVTIDIFTFALYNYKIDLTLTSLAVLLAGDLTEIYVDIIIINFRKVRPAKQAPAPKLNLSNIT
jgi:CHASE2 domain-containing sensor protein